MSEERSPAPPGTLRWLPGIAALRGYDAAGLRHDLAAGLVMTAMLVPVGIAYAVASGVPGIYGLYATIVPLLVYALVGPSRILVLGPDSALAPLILAVVLPLSAGDPARAVALAGAMAIVSGLICVGVGLARLGFFTELLSKPIRYGYMNGIAATVLISQLPKLFGFSVEADHPLAALWAFAQGVAAGRTNVAALAIGATALAAILLFERAPRIPGMFVAVAAATLAVAVFGLEARGVGVLGDLPAGLPVFAVPWIGVADLAAVLAGGAAVALVSFVDTSVLSRAYAARTGARVDPDQELVALGAVNLATGLFQGFAVSSSSSRTAVAEAAGARTQITGVVGALAVAALLLFAPGLLHHLPYAALAAVVIAAALGLFEIADLRRIHRIQRWEAWLSVGCAAGVVLFGAIAGIGLAILLALAEFVWDAWRPYSAVLGRVPGMKGYHDVERHPEGRQVPGLLLLRWDAPLFFANAEWFHKRVLDAVAAAPTPVRWVVVAAEPVTSVDVTAGDMLAELDEALAAHGIELCFAEMKDPVKDKLKRFGLFARFGDAFFFPTVGAAVSAYLEAHAVEWQDWEDAAP